MKQVKISDLVCEIQDGVDYIGYVISKFHLLGLKSYLYNKRMQNHKGIIIIGEFEGKFHLTSEDFEDMLKFDLKVLFLKEKEIKNVNDIYNWSKKFVSILLNHKNYDNKSIKIFCPREISLFLAMVLYNCKQFNIKYVLLDEGIGTYMSLQHIFGAFINENRAGIFNRSIYFFKMLLKSLLKKIYNPEKYFLYDISDGYLKPHTEIINEYINWILYSNSFNKYTIYELNNTHIVLFCGQPWVELGGIQQSTELSLLKDFQTICHANNCKFIYKPHVRESDEKIKIYSQQLYNTIILKDSRTLEELLPKINPCLIISYNSTALINAFYLFNIKSMIIAKYVINNFETNKYFLRASEELIKRINSCDLCIAETINDILDTIKRQ